MQIHHSTKDFKGMSSVINLQLSIYVQSAILSCSAPSQPAPKECGIIMQNEVKGNQSSG